MLEITAKIIPGDSVAGFRIGEVVTANVFERYPANVQTLIGCTRLNFGEVSLWVTENKVVQIGVFEGYRGKIADKIGIGSTMEEVEKTLGKITEDEEGNLVVPSVPGFCFETEEWGEGDEIEDNLQAKVTEIFVFSKGK